MVIIVQNCAREREVDIGLQVDTAITSFIFQK